MNHQPFDDLPPAFQRYAHDEYLGGEGSRLRGLSREERDIMYGSSSLKRTLKCAPQIRELLKEE